MNCSSQLLKCHYTSFSPSLSTLARTLARRVRSLTQLGAWSNLMLYGGSWITWRAASPQLVLPYWSTLLIHSSAWKGNSANFASTEFSEVRRCGGVLQGDT